MSKTTENTGEKISRGKLRVKGFREPEMEFQLIRSLGAIYSGGGAIGECLLVVSRMKEETPDCWTEEFTKLAKSVEAEGDSRLADGHKFTARDQFLRACNYYRAAEYFVHPIGTSKVELGMKSRECFIKYLELSGIHYEIIDIPFRDIFMPSYFLSPDNSGKKRRTIIVLSGFDGTTEESYLQFGKAALERGYNVLLTEGPGQAGTRRFFPDSPFIPDFEAPISTAIDYLEGRTDVDMETLSLLGISLGGYFAARGAAYDNRIKALILNSPIIDMHRYFSSFFNPDDFEKAKLLTTEIILSLPEGAVPPAIAVTSLNLILRFGKNSIGEAFEYMKEFRMGDALKDITCRSLALFGEGEGEDPMKQTEEYCAGVTGPVTQYMFRVDQGADAHCQVGNGAISWGVILDWLQ